LDEVCICGNPGGNLASTKFVEESYVLPQHCR
jgi:hypothetical protein